MCSFFVPESPKFLLKKQLYDKSSHVFQRIARLNGRYEELNAFSAERIQQVCDENDARKNENDANLTMTVILNNTSRGDSSSTVNDQLCEKAGLE